jgi:hypothetical protein
MNINERNRIMVTMTAVLAVIGLMSFFLTIRKDSNTNVAPPTTAASVATSSTPAETNSTAVPTTATSTAAPTYTQTTAPQTVSSRPVEPTALAPKVSDQSAPAATSAVTTPHPATTPPTVIVNNDDLNTLVKSCDDLTNSKLSSKNLYTFNSWPPSYTLTKGAVVFCTSQATPPDNRGQ